MPIKKHNIKAYCIRDSIINGASKGYSFKERVLDKNQNLLTSIRQDQEAEGFDSVTLAMMDPYDIASYRVDHLAIGESVYALPLIQQYLNYKSQSNCYTIDTMMLVDVFDSIDHGTYKKLLANAHQPYNIRMPAPATTFTDSLIAVHTYFHAHQNAIRLQAENAKNNIDTQITLDVIGKDKDVSDQVYAFFANNTDLLPKIVRLTVSYYYYYENGENKGLRFCYVKNRTTADEGDQAFIQGTGEIDTNVEWSIRYFFATHDHAMTSSEELLQFHTNKSYVKYNPAMLTTFGTDKFDAEQFLIFRNNHITKLPSTLPKADYTTAVALAQENLFPESLLSSAKQFATPLIKPTLLSSGQPINMPHQRRNSLVMQPKSIEIYEEGGDLHAAEKVPFINYANNQYTIAQYIDCMKAHDYDLIDYQDSILVQAIKEIAKHDSWSTKGGLFYATTPRGILDIQRFEGSDIRLLADTIINKKADATRGVATRDFYELIVALAKPTPVNGTVKLQAINAYCKKHMHSFRPSLILERRNHRSSSLILHHASMPE